MRAGVQIARLSAAALGDDDRSAWRELADRALEPNPFFDPEFVAAAVAHLDGGSRVELLVVRRGDRWLACVPVLRRPKWSDLWLPCVRVWNHPYCFDATPLVDRDELDVVAEALSGWSSRWPARAFLALESMGEGAISRAVVECASLDAAPPVVHSGFRRAMLERRETDTYLAEASSGKRARELRRTRRTLDAALGASATLRDVSGDPSALDRLLALEGAGWKGRAGTALRSDPSHEAFVREMWTAFVGRGRGHLLELGVEGRVAASLMCVSAGDRVFAFKTGHDEELRSGSPGVQLMADAATWFHERRRFARFDSCAVRDNAMINALWPDRRDLVTTVLPASGLAGRAARAMLRRHARRV